ncbi:Fe-S cluster assembly protein HesB [candidate division GN15 bacterium]|uniref:Adenine DNA glycosylase n=1 Tax=candidate division GN15 bacterium TaxID=2072418 RepID=A0A855X396_9BACT|nr:MAG: Fe-S cluster assembly protein HesB [candidate division GN15 bacterium]
MTAQTPQRYLLFRRKLFLFYEKHGRDLPWRRTTDPYRITVAELMLQQTQVERVLLKYAAWITRWPNWQALSKATNRELLAQWSGLGYNRRALYLGRMARSIVHEYDGAMPRTLPELQKLPGIGRYTARAILIFAFNEPIATIDTNIRRVLLHEFNLPGTTPTSRMEALAEKLLPKRRSRDWHNALMDYSRLVLPRRIEGIRSGGRQSKFEGSLRQIRGEIVRQLTMRESITIQSVASTQHRTVDDVLKAAEGLRKEGVIVIEGRRIRLS